MKNQPEVEFGNMPVLGTTEFRQKQGWRFFVGQDDANRLYVRETIDKGWDRGATWFPEVGSKEYRVAFDTWQRLNGLVPPEVLEEEFLESIGRGADYRKDTGLDVARFRLKPDKQ
jgi:hypothetical protein